MKDKKYRFVFITPFIEEDFFIPVKKGIRDAEKLFEVQVGFTGTKDANIDKLKSIFERCVNEGYDGIVLSLCHPTEFNTVVNGAVEKSVPVVAFNIDTRDAGNKRLSSVCQNLYEAGRSVGRASLPYIKEGSKILMTMHDEGIAALEERLAGEQEILKEKDVKWKVIVTGNTPDIAAKTILDTLNNDKEISAIICTGQSDTEGAGIAADSERNKRNIYVAGFDLSSGILKFIEKGIINFSVDQQPYAQGFYPVVQLYFYCSYGIKPSNIDTGAAIVNKANIATTIAANQLGYR